MALEVITLARCFPPFFAKEFNWIISMGVNIEKV